MNSGGILTSLEAPIVGAILVLVRLLPGRVRMCKVLVCITNAADLEDSKDRRVDDGDGADGCWQADLLQLVQRKRLGHCAVLPHEPRSRGVCVVCGY